MSDLAIFCDDIRQEQNGKLLLIGVYTGTMVISSFPFTGRLSILVASTEFSDGPMRFGLESSEGTTFGLLEAELESNQDYPDAASYLPLPPFPVILSSPTELRLYVEKDGVRRQLGSLLAVKPKA